MSEYGISDKSLRTYWLMKKYAVIIPAAINAKISPYKASPLIWKSCQPMMILPEIAMRQPIIAPLVNLSLNKNNHQSLRIKVVTLR